jgi:hypothetical protein
MIEVDIDASKHSQLLAISAESITKLEACISAAEKNASLKTRQDLQDSLARGISNKSAEALSQIAVSFSSFIDEGDADLSDMMAALLSGAKAAGLVEHELTELEARIPFVERLCRMPRVRQISKVREIRDGFSPRLMSGRVFTFSCPIFDAERSKVDGTLILNKLTLTCIDARGNEEVKDVTLNLRQLRKLSKEIERAIVKSESLKAFMKDSGQDWVIALDS